MAKKMLIIYEFPYIDFTEITEYNDNTDKKGAAFIHVGVFRADARRRTATKTTAHPYILTNL